MCVQQCQTTEGILIKTLLHQQYTVYVKCELQQFSLVSLVREVDKEPVKTETHDGHERQIHPVVERQLSHALLTDAVDVRLEPRRTRL